MRKSRSSLYRSASIYGFLFIALLWSLSVSEGSLGEYWWLLVLIMGVFALVIWEAMVEASIELRSAGLRQLSITGWKELAWTEVERLDVQDLRVQLIGSQATINVALRGWENPLKLVEALREGLGERFEALLDETRGSGLDFHQSQPEID